MHKDKYTRKEMVGLLINMASYFEHIEDINQEQEELLEQIYLALEAEGINVPIMV